MNKIKLKESNMKIAVDITELQNMLCIGKNSASKIGEEAGAVIRIGRRKLYNVKKINDYIERVTEGNVCK